MNSTYNFASEWCMHYILSDKRNVTWEKRGKFQHEARFPPKIKNVCLWVWGFIFSVKNFWTMNECNKSYAWTPSISNLASLPFFCRIWPSKVWKCDERPEFYQFLRFWVVRTFLKSYESFLNVYWRRMRYGNLIQKIKFEKIT